MISLAMGRDPILAEEVNVVDVARGGGMCQTSGSVRARCTILVRGSEGIACATTHLTTSIAMAVHGREHCERDQQLRCAVRRG